MGREIHKFKHKGKMHYGILSTVTMSYTQGFGSRKQTLQALVDEGYKKDVIGKMFKQASTIKFDYIPSRGARKPVVTVPVYRIKIK